ncbi:McrB family protein [Alteribacter keqinensis]|uniref:AAA+ ATPase domain-containing protein n=1 Tax=Alteribacter keqinensis TaxID=2483800 RepID=A0A3M7TWP9_9BACI|nr:AAA family ATPase [Alteribacter keqinensis]RNA70028.1 hypothetical protein EBO34_08885 [Alteribacter keqinensis]
MQMNLDRLQQLFEIDNTTERCREVLEYAEPKMQELFKNLKEKVEIEEDAFLEIKSYGATLRTTYHNSKNPNYAESKKDTEIGKRYYIKLNKVVHDDKINLITLEFNGVDQTWSAYAETRFYPMWAALASKKIEELTSKLPDTISLYFKEVSNKKGIKKVRELPENVRNYTKTLRKPFIYFGIFRDLQGNLDEGRLLIDLKRILDELAPLYSYLTEDCEESYLANKIYQLFLNENSPKEISLLGLPYRLEYGEIEKYKNEGKKQTFNLYDQDQLVVKGLIRYLEFSEKDAPTHRLAIHIDGHTHIFAKVRELLGEGKIRWWISKVFAKRNLDNQQLLKDSLNHLKGMGFEISESKYSPGIYDNDHEDFVEDTDKVKARLIKAALIFAHVSERLVLPDGTQKVKVVDEEVEDEEEIEDALESNFDFTSIYEIVKSSKLTFDLPIIRDFHLNLTALDDKHFVLLNGISGTGKTQLAKLYANAVYGLDFEDNNPYLSVIPVRPDWMDSTALFGYYSSFDKRYVVPEFLRMVLKARTERDKPHFILLDEMNLARVEYYLSDYLSAVESQEAVPLHDRDDIKEVPQTITIPPNVYVIGTVNVDETTHSISDKVLDRAYVMTLSDVDFDPFWETVTSSTRDKLSKEFAILKEVHQLLLPYDLHFGYRSMNEMVRKLMRNLELEMEYQMERHEALDVVIREKVLPKIRGDERIAPLFEEMKQLISEKIGAEARSLHELNRMQKELDRYGATQYWR